MPAPSTNPPPDPIPDPEPSVPSLPGPDPGVFHHDPPTPAPPATCIERLTISDLRLNV
jgi:hypothetical protein